MSMNTRARSDVSDPVIDLDMDVLERRCTTFIEDIVSDANADGVVVAMSGGIDSTTAATLAVEALGADAVYGLILPSEITNDANTSDAQDVAHSLNIDFRTIDIQPVLNWLERAMLFGDPPTKLPHFTGADPILEPDDYKQSRGNAMARLRMTMAYFEANTRNSLVLGTGNRTELLLGYFTKHGDGGVDLLPLGDLYKTEVRALARHLDVPERIIEKPPTAGLWDGQSDESELGASYETIDAILRGSVDRDRSKRDVATKVGGRRMLVERITSMHDRSTHKRTMPPKPSTYQ